jgi:hypothetical protein
VIASAGTPHRFAGDCHQIRLLAPRFVAVITIVIVLGACSSGAAPTASSPATPQTATPVVTAQVTAAATPLPTATIVRVTAIPGAPDSGIVVELSTNGYHWSLRNIDAPAGKVWHVHIVSTAAQRNNFTVATGPKLADYIFNSKDFTQGTFTFDIPALPAGDYIFKCTNDVANMHGSLTVR